MLPYLLAMTLSLVCVVLVLFTSAILYFTAPTPITRATSSTVATRSSVFRHWNFAPRSDSASHLYFSVKPSSHSRASCTCCYCFGVWGYFSVKAA